MRPCPSLFGKPVSRPFEFLPGLLVLLLLLCGCPGRGQTAGPPGPLRNLNAPAPAAVPVAFTLVRSQPVAKVPVLPGVDLVTAVERVAETNIPAVVHIEATERQEMEHPLLPFMQDPFFRRFFDSPGVPEKFEREVQGIGTGMLMDAQGHILTNYHVAGGATSVQVLLADGRSFPAQLVGGDPYTDLAVLRISADDAFPYVHFGDSDQTKVGEWVVAIGHPRGLDQTVTQGIISAKHRTGIMDPSNFQDFLQTDAAINPGNSGGPLLNLRGEVIGINAAIQSISGGYEGIGFAIPSNMALYVARQLIEKGEVKRGWLGVGVQDITLEMADALGLQEREGALVTQVMEDSPASRAGVRKNDVITSFRGKKITDAATLRNEVAVTLVGDDVILDVLRNGQKQEIPLRIGSMEEAQGRMAAATKERVGVEVGPIPQETAAKYGLEPGQGIQITWIDPDGPLGRSGFEPGDLILAINDLQVGDPQNFAAIIHQLPAGQPVVLLTVDNRSGNVGLIQVQLDQ